MTDEDLLPLKAGGDAPPELVRSLHELGQDSVDAARLERLAQGLAASLAGVRPPPASGPLRGRPGRRTLLACFAVGFAALAWFGYHAFGCSRSPRAQTSHSTANAQDQRPGR